MSTEQRPPFPPFDADSAREKVRKAENGWNGKNPQAVSMAYTADSRWRNRNEFLQGRAQIQSFLQDKWEKELNYRLCKELWAFRENRIAVRFAYEWHDHNGEWFRSYGNENWEFSPDGLMQLRLASINDLAIDVSERKLIWDGDKRPDDFPGKSPHHSTRFH